MKNNYNNFDKTYDCKNKNLKDEQSYSYYSRLLNKPFDTVEELKAAEEALRAEQRAKEDKAAKKKADAVKVEDAFKALNAARKEYKEKITQLATEYAEELENLKKAFDLGKKDILNNLATAEEAYEKALKEFTEKYPEGFHIKLKDGDFETTISRSTDTTEATSTPKMSDVFDIFDWMFRH